jgi:hypothetical protein
MSVYLHSGALAAGDESFWGPVRAAASLGAQYGTAGEPQLYNLEGILTMCLGHKSRGPSSLFFSLHPFKCKSTASVLTLLPSTCPCASARFWMFFGLPKQSICPANPAFCLSLPLPAIWKGHLHPFCSSFESDTFSDTSAGTAYFNSIFLCAYRGTQLW